MKRFSTPWLLLVLTLFTSSAAAQLVPVSDAFGLGIWNGLDAPTAVAARPDGTYLILSTYGDFTENRLDLRIVGPGGAVIDSLVIDTQGARSPAIAFPPDGGFIVVYQKAGEILGVLFDHHGEEKTRLLIGPRRQPELVNGDPAVAVAADGSWMVAWQEREQQAFLGTIQGRWLAPDGTPKTQPAVLDELSFQQRLPQVAAASDGSFFVLWSETLGDVGTPVVPDRLRGRRFDSQGNPLHGTEDLALSSAGRLFPRPGGDGFILLEDVDSSRGSRLQRLDLNGQLVGPAMETGLPGSGDPVASAIDSDGRLLLAVMALDGRVYARLFDGSRLQPLSATFEVPSLWGMKHLASAWPGQFLAIWQETIPITTPLPPTFMAQILTLDCNASADVLCLGNGRFRAQVSWRDHQGNTGVGRPVPLGDDTGTFSFFSTSNVELLVKILDGRSVNGHFWVFYGSLSDVEYTIRVEDTVTGQVRTYENPSGHIASHADVQAFPASATATTASRPTVVAPLLAPRNVTAPLTPPLPLTCFYGDFALCLLGRKYEVTVEFIDPLTGESRLARALPFSWESGAFWFFDKGNVELYVKVLDGSAVNGRAWVFHGALTDVEYTITVRYTAHPLEVWTYHNPRGRMYSGADTSALPPPGASTFSLEMGRQP